MRISGAVVTVNSQIEDTRADGSAIRTVRHEGGLRLKGKRTEPTLAKPLITIITSTYNAAEHLPTALKSIREQTYDNVELIVVDGGSRDGTLDILRENEDVIDYWISEPDKGIYDAWNKGLRLAQGEWICFLGADDRLMPDAIESMVTCTLTSQRSLEFVSGRVKLFRDGKAGRTIGRPWNWPEFRRYMCVAHTGAMHRSSYFKHYGEFDTLYRISGDYEILLRAGSNLRAGFVDKVLTHAVLGGVSNREKAVFRENLRAKLSNGTCNRFWGAAFMVWAQFKWSVRRLLGK
ncbi:MAG: glycosyltransferase [Thiobacillus sp.]|nr:glycosyltransferase [Thiobacillus sp.]MBC2740992.1 glycosyltransferase [Thiobacillus sp.]